MSKRLSPNCSSSSSDSDEVEWSERKTDPNDWFRVIENNCTQSHKKTTKSDEKRNQELKDQKIRFERELNPYFRKEVDKTFEDKSGLDVNQCRNVSVVENKSKTLRNSLTERNSINAKLLKAEMLGNERLVNELKTQLKQLEDNERLNTTSAEDNVRNEEYYSVREKPNEESMSLKEMYLREKRTTAEDENRRFIASSSKIVRNPDEEYEDMKHKHKRPKNDSNLVRYVKHSDEDKSCEQCVSKIAKHLILSIGENTAITLSPYEPFTYGYCFLLSKSHSNVSTILSDEETLAEIYQKKKQISQFFDKKNLSVVFMETYFKRKSFSNRHLIIECVPIKKKYENEAQIFFKKAIMECEEEWAMNKKVIQMNGKCVTKLIPKGLPYFWVTFGPKNNGFAHVIEDEELFPKNFGKEILGGLLDIEPNKWQKNKYQNYEQQYDRVINIKNEWNKTFS